MLLLYRLILEYEENKKDFLWYMGKASSALHLPMNGKDINFNSNVEGGRKVIEVAAWEKPTFKSWGKKDMLISGWNIDHVKFYLSN